MRDEKVRMKIVHTGYYPRSNHGVSDLNVLLYQTLNIPSWSHYYPHFILFNQCIFLFRFS